MEGTQENACDAKLPQKQREFDIEIDNIQTTVDDLFNVEQRIFEFLGRIRQSPPLNEANTKEQCEEPIVLLDRLRYKHTRMRSHLTNINAMLGELDDYI